MTERKKEITIVEFFTQECTFPRWAWWVFFLMFLWFH